MEQEFTLRMLDQSLGRVALNWDELHLNAQATLRWKGEGLWKLTLIGVGGSFLLGTLVPEGGRFLLRRTLSLSEVRRAGAWPAQGASLSFLCPFDSAAPFPMPSLFCFARAEGGSLRFAFGPEGTPQMPEGR